MRQYRLQEAMVVATEAMIGQEAIEQLQKLWLQLQSGGCSFRGYGDAEAMLKDTEAMVAPSDHMVEVEQIIMTASEAMVAVTKNGRGHGCTILVYGYSYRGDDGGNFRGDDGGNFRGYSCE